MRHEHRSAIAASLLAVVLAACNQPSGISAGAADGAPLAASHAQSESSAPSVRHTGNQTNSPAQRHGAAGDVAAAAEAARAASALTAYKAVDTLKTSTWLSHAGYSRSQFGKAWIDVDGNHCDTRDDILARDLRSISRAGACKVLSGTLRDPYTGQTIYYVRGNGSGVDIDHVVALSNAWETGAAVWVYSKRAALANDPANLLAVDASANRQKGDADAGAWLPQTSYQCAYVARQVMVKRKYQLFVTSDEKSAMKRVLSRCSSIRLPNPGSQPTTAANAGAPPLSSSTAVGDTNASTTHAGLDPRFSSCAKAKAAGYGPYVRGRDSEYAWYRDGDGDGIDCE